MTDLAELEIKSLGAQGDGVAEYDGTSVFVPGTVPGDKILAKVMGCSKKGVSAELVNIVHPSDHRVEPLCEHFDTCGGCQLQYIAAEQYKKWLAERAKMALVPHGMEAVPIAEPQITPVGSRRRVALKVRKIASGVILGFNEYKSHQIVDIAECPVTRREITGIFPPLRTVLGQILQPRMQANVHITLTATGLDVLVDAPMELGLEAREGLVSFAEDYDIAAIHWRDEGFLDPVAIHRTPMMDFSGVYVPLQPASFIQATAEGENALVKEVLNATEGHKRVADLFCGMGTFTFPLARHHQVLAVEGAKASLDALQAAINRAGPDLKQIVPLHRDLFRRPLTSKELSAFDAVVFDPPRTGAKEQAEGIVQSDVKTVVAVSCNPNTFARDARILVDGGYTFEKLVPVDQFLWSPHLELVGVFRKNS